MRDIAYQMRNREEQYNRVEDMMAGPMTGHLVMLANMLEGARYDGRKIVKVDNYRDGQLWLEVSRPGDQLGVDSYVLTVEERP